MTFREPLPVNEEGDLPKELQDIVVKKPTNDVDRPGGPGLADLDGLLESGSKRPESEWTKLKDAQDATSTGSAYLDVRLELSSDSLKLKRRSRHQLYGISLLNRRFQYSDAWQTPICRVGEIHCTLL